MTRVVDGLGVAVDAPLELSGDTMVQRPAVAQVGTDDDYLVAWRVLAGPSNQIKVRYVTGVMASPEHTVVDAGVISAVGLLGREDGTAVAAWAEGSQNSNLYAMQLFDSTQNLSPRVTIAERQGSAASRPDLVVTSATQFAVVYQNCPSECDIFMRRYEIDNNTLVEVGPEVAVPADASGDQRDPSIAAIYDGDAIDSVMVTWTEETSEGLFRVEGRIVPLASLQ
jgi:hypothetical protein